jgi:hypothetical protein
MPGIPTPALGVTNFISDERSLIRYQSRRPVTNSVTADELANSRPRQSRAMDRTVKIRTGPSHSGARWLTVCHDDPRSGPPAHRMPRRGPLR